MVFAVGHYSDSRDRAEDEATSLVALYDALGVYLPRYQGHRPARPRLLYALDRLRRLAVDGSREHDRGTSRTLAVRRSESARMYATCRSTLSGEGSAYGRAVGFISDASESRQQLLFFTEP